MTLQFISRIAVIGLIWLSPDIYAQPGMVSEDNIARMRSMALAMSNPAHPSELVESAEVSFESQLKRMGLSEASMPTSYRRDIIDMRAPVNALLGLGCEVRKIIPSGIAKTSGGLNGASLLATCGRDYLLVQRMINGPDVKGKMEIHSDAINSSVRGYRSSNRYMKSKDGLELSSISWTAGSNYYHVQYYSLDPSLSPQSKSAASAKSIADLLSAS